MLIKTLALTLALPALVASHGHTGPSYDKDLGYWPEEDCLPEPEPEPEPEPSINPNYHSVGSCYTHGADPSVTCNIAAADCEAGGGSPYDPGYISGYSGCCHCEGSCDHSQETSEDTCAYPDTVTSVGSCYTHGADPSVTCNVAAADCEAAGGSPYDPGYISGYSGCCHCFGDCDHSAETGDSCTYTDAPVVPEPELEPEELTSVGSCYMHGADPSVTCNVAAADCEAAGGSPYDPGYVRRFLDVAVSTFHYENTLSARAREHIQLNRRLEAEGEGTCHYSDKCCKNPLTDDCVLIGHVPVGHSDVVLDHCPTAEEGASGLFSEEVDETMGRFGGCCKEEAASVDWEYVDGTSTGADIEGNTGCQRDGSCEYLGQTCCYNSAGDHRCWLYEGLPLLPGTYGGMAACPMPSGPQGWIYQVDESDGRDNHCCEDLGDFVMPPNFRTQALDGNPCFVTTAKRTTKLGDCTDFTGHFAGYALTDYVSSDIHIFADDAAAVAAGCTLGEHPEKIVDCSAAVQEMKVAFSEEITLPPMEVPEGVEGALEMVANILEATLLELIGGDNVEVTVTSINGIAVLPSRRRRLDDGDATVVEFAVTVTEPCAGGVCADDANAGVAAVAALSESLVTLEENMENFDEVMATKAVEVAEAAFDGEELPAEVAAMVTAMDDMVVTADAFAAPTAEEVETGAAETVAINIAPDETADDESADEEEEEDMFGDGAAGTATVAVGALGVAALVVAGL
ncbi:hypothetical protein TeGR_g12430 [Tetraparma gracilis]|uniref:Uncharacterized protein n=1 Tax=Tetraparma gracilis TaxID=2962635 RepID=A0ABQ6ME30_9STRA|nr:hypothetical protein TeGR_g12430 [Tetraparma gracilis]